MSFEDTGTFFEEVTLGHCGATYEGYLKWREAVELVRKCQPCKKRPAAQRLEQEVARRFGKFSLAVKFYTAVRSPLDFFHGVDAFFEFQGILVTLDATINPLKNSGRADIIVHAEDFDDLPALAARIASVFAAKIRRRR